MPLWYAGRRLIFEGRSSFCKTFFVVNYPTDHSPHSTLYHNLHIAARAMPKLSRDHKSDPNPTPKSEDSSGVEAAAVTSSEPFVIEGGYGWICVVAVCFMNAHTWGISTVSFPQPRSCSLSLTETAPGSATACSWHTTRHLVPLPAPQLSTTPSSVASSTPRLSSSHL